jgi:Transposase IS66 family
MPQFTSLDQRRDDGPVLTAPSEAAKRAFFRFSVIVRIVRSTTLELMSTRPSSRKPADEHAAPRHCGRECPSRFRKALRCVRAPRWQRRRAGRGELVEAAADGYRGMEQVRSRPIVEDLEPWLRAKLALISQKTKLAETIRYALSRRDGLTRPLDHSYG